jgi:hypothetical protein
MPCRVPGRAATVLQVEQTPKQEFRIVCPPCYLSLYQARLKLKAIGKRFEFYQRITSTRMLNCFIIPFLFGNAGSCAKPSLVLGQEQF